MVLFQNYFSILILALNLKFSQSLQLNGGNSQRVLASAPCEGKACQQSADLSSEAATASADEDQRPVKKVKLSKPETPRFEWMQQKELKKENGQKEGLASFIKYQNQLNMTNESNFDIQSFISKDLIVKAALDKIEKFCDPKGEDSFWLECDRHKNGTLVSMAGAYGVAVFGRLINNGSHNVKVYRNLNLKAEGKSLMDIDWDENHLVTVSRPLPIVIKLTTSKADKKNKKLPFPEITALDKEVRRFRSVTKFKFPNGKSITPKIYDVRINGTKLAHSINEVAYIQEQVLGANAFSVLEELIANKSASMFYHLQMVLNELDKWINTLKSEGLETGEKSKSSDALNTESPEAAEHRHSFEVAANRFIKELWLRARSRLSLISFVYNAAFLMWKDMMHCDCHWKNIMLVKEKIKTEAELESAKRDGATIILNPNIYLSNFTVSRKEMKKLKKDGFVVYRLTLDRVKFIDLGQALPISEILEDIKQSKLWSKLGGSRKQYLYSPCTVNRPKMAEDFWELHRLGAKTALGSDKFRYLDIYEEAKLEFQEFQWDESLKVTDVKRQFRNTFEYVSFFMKKVKKEVLELETIFKTASKQMKRMEVLTDCEPQWSDEIFEAAHSLKPWHYSKEVAGTYCSLKAMKAGVRNVQGILKEAARHFPSYAPVTLFDDS